MKAMAGLGHVFTQPPAAAVGGVALTDRAHVFNREKDLMATKTLRRVAAVTAAALLTGTVALTAPAQASAPTTVPADFAGGGAACPQLPDQSSSTLRVGTIVGQGDGTAKFFPEGSLRLPWVATSSAWVTAPPSETVSGYTLVINGKGAGMALRSDNEYTMDKAIAVRGSFQGLRVITDAGSTGNPDSTRGERGDLVYGIDTRGRLVRMPVTWSASGIPSFGKQQVIASGFGRVMDVRLSFYRYKNWAPTEDALVGITDSGAFLEWTVTRGPKPTVKTRTLAKSGYAGVVKLRYDTCITGDESVLWVMIRRDGSLVSYIDPKPYDSSLKGMKTEGQPDRPPAGVVTF